MKAFIAFKRNNSTKICTFSMEEGCNTDFKSTELEFFILEIILKARRLAWSLHTNFGALAVISEHGFS